MYGSSELAVRWVMPATEHVRHYIHSVLAPEYRAIVDLKAGQTTQSFIQCSGERRTLRQTEMTKSVKIKKQE